MTQQNTRTTYKRIQTLASRLNSVAESNKDAFFAKTQKKTTVSKSIKEIERRRSFNY